MPITPKIVIPAILGLAIGVILVMTAVFLTKAVFSEPFQVFGMGAAPDQPIDFPHDVHVEKVGIECMFCHRTVDTEASAGIPAVEQCLFCHKDLGREQYILPESEELEALRAHFEEGEPIQWNRVHRLPDHVQFFHEPHIRFFTQTEEGRVETLRRAGSYNLPMSSPPEPGELVEASCAICHGKVRAMD